MKKYVGLFAVLLVALLHHGCTTSRQGRQSVAAISAAQLHPFGRTQMRNDSVLELVGSAAHVGFTFSGTECKIFATIPAGNGHNYLQYEIDGKYQRRIRVAGGGQEPIVLNAATGGTHTVWLYKATEAHTGPILIQKVTGINIKPVQRGQAPLIEFIGNSITCGAAADPSEVPCGTGVYHDQHNAYYAYGPRLARALSANFLLSSVSGIGVYRNWNSDGPAMPQVYESTSFQTDTTDRWDFSKYSPQIVSIALGTNDFSNGDGVKKRLPFDSAAFVQQYIRFVQLVQTKYPQAQIALLSSPMVKGSAREMLQRCITAVQKEVDAQPTSGKKLAVYFFKPMAAGGCTGHPNVEDHEILADELLPFFKSLIP